MLRNALEGAIYKKKVTVEALIENWGSLVVSTGHTSPAGDHRKNWPDSGLGAAAAWAAANYSVHQGPGGASTRSKENCFTTPALSSNTETCDPVSWCHGVITQLSWLSWACRDMWRNDPAGGNNCDTVTLSSSSCHVTISTITPHPQPQITHHQSQ